MKVSLKSKLTASYILIVIIVVGLICFGVNRTVKTTFENFVLNKQERQTHEIVEALLLNYKTGAGWEGNSLDIIGMNALQKGLIIEIFDEDGLLIWSAYEHNNGLCHAIISNMWANMNRYSNNWEGEYIENNYSLQKAGMEIGTLTTGYVGPYYFTDEELTFITSLNQTIVMIGIGSIAIAIFLGFIMSSRISKPLNTIAKKTSLLSVGNYKERLRLKSNTNEIVLLVDSINSLSQALENKENLQKQLTQDVAHELRTPLTSIQGNLEAMIDGIWEMDKDRLLSCYEELERIKRMIGSIEILSKVENDMVILKKEEFDLITLLNHLIINFYHKCKKKNITIEIACCEKEIVMFGDKDKISQVFTNLISNGIMYSNPNQSLLIQLDTKEHEINIRVSDTGIGIGEEELPHIFERFYRVDKSRSRYTGGMGIGLTISKSIVEAHNGSIQVTSKEGFGTTFYLVFPII